MRLNEDLLRQAKEEAMLRGTTLSSLIEAGLRLVLSKPPRSRVRVMTPVSRCTGGLALGVDLDNSAALLDFLEGRG